MAWRGVEWRGVAVACCPLARSDSSRYLFLVRSVQEQTVVITKLQQRLVRVILPPWAWGLAERDTKRKNTKNTTMKWKEWKKKRKKNNLEHNDDEAKTSVRIKSSKEDSSNHREEVARLYNRSRKSRNKRMAKETRGESCWGENPRIARGKDAQVESKTGKRYALWPYGMIEFASLWIFPKLKANAASAPSASSSERSRKATHVCRGVSYLFLLVFVLQMHFFPVVPWLARLKTRQQLRLAVMGPRWNVEGRGPAGPCEAQEGSG